VTALAERILGRATTLAWTSRRAAFAGVIVLVLLANAFAVSYVLREKTIYYWDTAGYWQDYGSIGQLLAHNLSHAFANIKWSIAHQDYNLLPVVPLAPVEWAFGPGRLAYILALTNISLVSAALLLAVLARRMIGALSGPLFVVGLGALLALHVLWAPTLRGLPDVLGVTVACGILLLHFGKPLAEQGPARFATTGLLLCLLVLVRRWYLFWAVGFFPAALVAQSLASMQSVRDWRRFGFVAGALILVGVTFTTAFVLAAWPLLVKIAFTDYSNIYAAYHVSHTPIGTVKRIVEHFGSAIFTISLAGLIWLTVRRQTRAFGVFLLLQAIIVVALFTRVQDFGVQHFYLLVPAAGIGLVAAMAGIWTAQASVIWRSVGVAGISGAVVLSSIVVFASRPLDAGPFLPRVLFAPMVRNDLGELDRLLDALDALPSGQVYLVASSDVLNWSVLQNACRQRHHAHCERIEVTQEVDARDGFPSKFLTASYVIVATPTQYHLDPAGQREIGVLANDVQNSSGVGESFVRLPGVYNFDYGAHASIYRKTAPLRPGSLVALRQELDLPEKSATDLIRPYP
jgi:hypothetical protein